MYGEFTPQWWADAKTVELVVTSAITRVSSATFATSDIHLGGVGVSYQNPILEPSNDWDSEVGFIPWGQVLAITKAS